MSEKAIHKAICKYIDLAYPDVIYTSDASGLRLSMGLRVQMKAIRCNNYVIPDLIILNPAGTQHGLLLEVKKDKNEVYRKDGEMRQDEHIKSQAKVLFRLEQLGYRAEFACGFDHAKSIIDEYMKL